MLIKVRVYPESLRQEIKKKKNDSFSVYVKEKAEKGRANRAMIDTLAIYFGILPSKIRLRRGARQPNKVIEIPDGLVEPR